MITLYEGINIRGNGGLNPSAVFTSQPYPLLDAFDCCPQRYPSTAEVLTGVLGDTFTIPNTANLVKGLPLISTGAWAANDTSGTIVTNSLSITIPQLSTSQSAIYIDFETHTIFNVSGDRITSATITGTWSALGGGDTIVTTKTHGTAPTIEVKTRRWNL